MAERGVNEDPMDVKWWDEETDVVIAGGSYAGLAAAVSARERGASVIILEEAKSNLHPCGRDGRGYVGIFAAESSLQKKEGIDVTRDWAFKYAMDCAHWRCNAPLVRRIIDDSPYLIDWLMQHGVTFKSVGKIIPHYPREWHYFGDQSLEVIRVLTKCAEEKNAKFMYQTRATDLIISPEGRIIGIKAATDEGIFRIKARVVVLATGGTSFFMKLGPGATPDPNKPDGIRMARCAGAVIDYIDQYTGGFGLMKMMPPELNELRRVIEQPFLWVNKSGERVFDEGYTYQGEMINVAEYQRDRALIQIFDESSKNSLMNTGVKFLQHGTISQKLTNLDEQIQEGLKEGLIEKASTIRELAAKIMVDSTILENTINQYNEFCDKKHDVIFLKDPAYLEPVRESPFYAIVCEQGFRGGPGGREFGGIRISINCQALDSNNRAIPGLYAVGQDAAGMYGSFYPLQMAGVNLTFEIDTGRIAGENAAAETE